MYETTTELPMNWIAKPRFLLTVLVLVCAGCSAPATETLVAGDPLRYSVSYSIKPHPASGTVDVTMQVTQARDLLRQVRFAVDSRITNVRVDGGSKTGDKELTWRPGASGGSLSWTVAKLPVSTVDTRITFSTLWPPNWIVVPSEVSVLTA